MHGRQLGHSEWHEVTQHQIDLFAEATWDRQWIHVDAERAARGPYGGTIAHGFLTISLTPALMAEIWSVEGIDMTVNRGLGEVVLHAPLPVGARVRMRAELVETRPRPRGFLEAHFRLVFEGDHGEGIRRVATAMLTLLLHVADPTGPVAAE